MVTYWLRRMSWQAVMFACGWRLWFCFRADGTVRDYWIDPETRAVMRGTEARAVMVARLRGTPGGDASA